MFKDIKSFLKKKEVKTSLCIAAVTLLCYLSSGSEGVTDEYGVVYREDYDGSEQSVYLEADIEGVGTETMFLDIKNRQYTDEECEAMHDECLPKIMDVMLNGNPSIEEVSGDLNFSECLSGYPFSFSWNVGSKGSFDSHGKLIAHEGGAVSVILTMTYGEWESEDIFEIHYEAAAYDDLQQVRDELITAVRESEEEDRTGEAVFLPPEIEGRRVTYREPATEKDPVIFLLGVAAMAFVFVGAQADRKNEEKKRREKLIDEYPTVIMKMVMYLSSGMTIRNVWIRIYEDSLSGDKKSPIYDEMGITVNELKTGVSEAAAYKDFSKRTAVPAITRFTTLLTQNLKTGSTNLSKLLSGEAEDAFEERKRRARVKGEEAGTKLLLPMTLLMLVVMVIIMIPAFLSM
ncbi:MAG: type II secretion system F family protein [Lachnospiraceae bacterium]|nr:type II secretion system F family protein [Lachnospiraceae bacterium]